MANTLAVLNGKLATQVRDTAYATWLTGEIDDLINWSVGQLWPRCARAIAPANASITLVAGTTNYSLPTGVLAVSRAYWFNAAGTEVGPIAGRSWEITGDPLTGAGYLHIAAPLTQGAGTLKLMAYGRYDTTTNLIPDEFVPLVLARARAEAYRRMGADRVKFKDWLARNQSQNMSINELVELINEADREVVRLEAQHKVWQHPVSGRTG
jgi:hypothetical protein